MSIPHIRHALVAVFCYGLFFLPGTSLGQTVDLMAASVEDYLRIQTQGLPGKITYSLLPLDPRTQLSPCNAFQPFLPHGSKLWGKTTIGVRCLGPSNWTIYLQAHIKASGHYLVSARPIRSGQIITADDLMVRSGELSALPQSILTEPAQAIGKTAKNSLSVGHPLRSDQFIAPWAVQQGQNVRIISKGAGFTVSSEGKALNNATEGQVVQVRTTHGQTLSGIARGVGIVEISH